MDKQYLVIWGTRRQQEPLCGTVVRVEHPPHEEPKGTILEEFAIHAVAEHNNIDPDGLNCYSVVELPNHVWCNGHSKEVVIGGRAASLECGHSGWRLHI